MGIPWYVPLIAALISSLPGWIGLIRGRAASDPGTEMSEPRFSRGWQFWVAVIFPILAWGAVGMDFYLRNNNPQQVPLILSWGVSGQPVKPGDSSGPPLYLMNINTLPLSSYKDKFNVLLIARVKFANVNRLTDKTIEKSVAYNIEDGAMTLAHPSDQKLRFAISMPNEVEFNLTIIPKTITTDQITDLADIPNLGGQILANVSQVVPGPPAPAIVPAQSSAPPVTP